MRSISAVLTSVLALLSSDCGSIRSEQPPRIRVLLHSKGKSLEIPPQDAEPVVAAAGDYFERANESMRLIMTDQRIQDIRKKQDALEIIYGSVRVIPWRGMQAHMRRLLIPLSGEFAGMVFFAGALSPPDEKLGDADVPDSYDGVNFARNPTGPQRIQKLIQEIMSKRRK
jgi:hypothetical protein